MSFSTHWGDGRLELAENAAKQSGRGPKIVNSMIDRIGLPDNRVLSKSDRDRAYMHCRKATEIIHARDTYISGNGLDDTIHHPGGIWASEDLSLTASWWYENSDRPNFLDCLRLIGPQFTGASFLPFEVIIGALAAGRTLPEIDQLLWEARNDLDHPCAIDTRWLALIRKLSKGMPSKWIAGPPPILGECGYLVRGVIVNRDTCLTQQRLNLIWRSGLAAYLEGKYHAGQSIQIIEIGGGYGALAYEVKRRYPNIDYMIVDLPESIAYSATYLGCALSDVPILMFDPANPTSVLDGPSAMRFVPNYAFDIVTREHYAPDLVINTLSFSEMSKAQIRYYGDRIKDLIGEQGLLFEQNQDNRHIDLMYCKEIFSQLFPCRQKMDRLRMRPPMGGRADLWANRPVTELLGAIC